LTARRIENIAAKVKDQLIDPEACSVGQLKLCRFREEQNIPRALIIYLAQYLCPMLQIPTTPAAVLLISMFDTSTGGVA
jgi:hypothetical protein